MRTYTEAQYSTPAAMQMIRDQFLGNRTDKESIEAAARYMARTLRIGPLPVCRALVVGAIQEQNARLIEAAPEMLDALQAAVNGWDGWIDEARAAIAKATNARP